MERIESAHNPKIKRLLELQKDSAARREAGLFVVEGQRELEHCVSAGLEIDSLFICPEIFPAATQDLFLAKLCQSRRSSRAQSSLFELPREPGGKALLKPNPVFAPQGSRAHVTSGQSTSSPTPIGDLRKIFEISKSLYEKVAYRGSTEGIIAEVRAKQLNLRDLKLKENPLIVVLEAVEKPGNLGAVLRSADAAGADAVIICDPLTDLFNPNLIRASIGAIFTVPTVACTSEEAIKWLKANKIQILTAQLQDSRLYYDTPMTQGTAIVMGTESTGLSEGWRKAADSHIRIPMNGQLDSLNVSVSAAILLFEAVRQRQ